MYQTTPKDLSSEEEQLNIRAAITEIERQRNEAHARILTSDNFAKAELYTTLMCKAKLSILHVLNLETHTNDELKKNVLKNYNKVITDEDCLNHYVACAIKQILSNISYAGICNGEDSMKILAENRAKLNILTEITNAFSAEYLLDMYANKDLRNR